MPQCLGVEYHGVYNLFSNDIGIDRQRCLNRNKEKEVCKYDKMLTIGESGGGFTDVHCHCFSSYCSV